MKEILPREGFGPSPEITEDQSLHEVNYLLEMSSTMSPEEKQEKRNTLAFPSLSSGGQDNQ